MTHYKLDSNIMRRFWNNVNVTSHCWLYKIDSRAVRGYGRFVIGNKSIAAHRFSYELFKGEIPLSFHIDHLCCILNCVNPNHLEAVTCKENIRRHHERKKKGFNQNTNKVFCKRNHIMEDNNLSVNIKTGKRQCKKCQVIRAIEWRNKNREKYNSTRKRYYENKNYAINMTRRKNNEKNILIANVIRQELGVV